MERIELSNTCKMILRAVKNGDYKKYEICYEDILVLISWTYYWDRSHWKKVCESPINEERYSLYYME